MNPEKKEWIEHFWKYLDKYGEKVVKDGTDGEKLFCFTASIKVLEDALKGRSI